MNLNPDFEDTTEAAYKYSVFDVSALGAAKMEAYIIEAKKQGYIVLGKYVFVNQASNVTTTSILVEMVKYGPN